MPTGAGTSFGWQEAMLGYVGVLVAGFLVSWVTTDLVHVRRTAYIAVLSIVSLGLGAGYLAWSGTALADVLVRHWAWGIVAGIVVAAALTPAIRRLPHTGAPEGSLVGPIVWEGVVYGIAEAVLLAALPVLTVWQAGDAAGWTASTAGAAASGVLAVVGSLLVILVHHLGYREFRVRSNRRMLGGALLGCGLQATAFLLTGTVLAPVVAHIVLHVQLIRSGNELPPAEHPVTHELPAGDLAPGSSVRSHRAPAPRS